MKTHPGELAFISISDADPLKYPMEHGLLTLLVFLSGLTGAFFLASNEAQGAESSLGDKGEVRGVDLCALQKDYQFFTGTPEWKPTAEGESGINRSLPLGCEDLMLLSDTIALSISGTEEVEADLELSGELRVLLSGFPIEVMTQAIAHYDREIAGLIVGIGKKESNWGKRTPKLNGEECYNFWGYRGAGDRGLTADGYGCWVTPEAAVKTIGDRLVKLRDVRESSTPERMIVWKCGSSCAGHSEESVKKWISDVNLYYRAIAFKP